MRQVGEIVLVILGVLGLGALKFGVPEGPIDEAKQFLIGPGEASGRSPSDDPWSKHYVDRPLVVYSNCDAARRAGVAPLHQGDAGYSIRLDRDLDGVACEPHPR